MMYKLTLGFNGTNYHGWQIQNNGNTIEECLEIAIKKCTGEFSKVTGCSRTDAGVHAINYVCNFMSNMSIPKESFPFAINTKLPEDIRVYKCETVSDDFHARFFAKSKTYIYKTYNNKIINPFYKDFIYHFPYNLDISKMQKAAEFFVGTHDFAGFMSTGGSQNTTVRTINFLNVSKENDYYVFEINANAYLYNMVRIICGTLLYVGCGKIELSDIPEIIESKNREKAGITAKPNGLYLKEVIY